MKNLSKVGIGSIDFETVGEIFSNLINSLFDESGNYITFVEKCYIKNNWNVTIINIYFFIWIIKKNFNHKK